MRPCMQACNDSRGVPCCCLAAALLAGGGSIRVLVPVGRWPLQSLGGLRAIFILGYLGGSLTHAIVRHRESAAAALAGRLSSPHTRPFHTAEGTNSCVKIARTFHLLEIDATSLHLRHSSPKRVPFTFGCFHARSKHGTRASVRSPRRHMC